MPPTQAEAASSSSPVSQPARTNFDQRYPKDAVFIIIEADSTFYLSDIVTMLPSGNPVDRGKHLDLATLSVNLKELGTKHPNLSVEIGVSKDTKYRDVIAVTSASKAAGLKDIEISGVEN